MSYDLEKKMNQNEKIEKAIKIIYSHYETMPDGSIKSKDKEAIILFTKNSTEYVESQSYKDNMEAMLLDIFETGFVFINDNTVIPIFNIKQYMALDKSEANKIVNTGNQNNKHFNRWNNKKKFHGKRPDDRGSQVKKDPIISNVEDFPVKDAEPASKEVEKPTIES